jgi:molybdate transport system substrate-binding protein
MHLNILSGGAAQGLVQSVADAFRAETGLDIAGSFGAVGAMREKLLAGEPADILVLTDAIVAELARDGHVAMDTVTPIGVVRTGVAVRSGSPKPAIVAADELRRALEAADGIYFPDPRLATAGIHFARVLTTLGINTDANPRLLTFPNGASAMKAMSASPLANPIGCTQVTEILNTAGVDLVGLLPKAFELATVYTAAVATQARYPREAARLAQMLIAAEAGPARRRLGFEAA